MKFVNLVIDNKSDNTDNLYTYECDKEAAIGSKVYVPFARGNRLREGYIVSISDKIDKNMKSRLKGVEKVDDDVSLSEEMIRTALWMKSRYICRYIDAVNCFTPSGDKAKRRARKNPFADEKGEPYEEKALTAEQLDVIEQIRAPIEKRISESFLLHGVTGSGKTEVYIRAVETVLANERTAIILVPEISLTTQIIDRFIGRFGNEAIAVLHSRLSPGERYDQWQKIRNGSVKIVIGARSAVFAPLENIGLIVIDEEHESTYKSDHTPKYDTVEVAFKRIRDNDNRGVLLLGSATPSVVSYSRGVEGIYKLLELRERYNRVRLPDMNVVDMRQELKSGNKSIISRELYGRMNECLKAGKQVILFLNRRGYSTFVSCRECGYVAQCPHCGLSLTFHKSKGKAVCHYCGYEETPTDICPDCGSRYIKYFGSGTEKVEEIVAEMFGEYRTERLDLDTVRKKGELERKIKAFRNGMTDILIGTQIIAKGLDFKNVGLVGVISADVSLNIPDFRAPERTFQLVTQAAGRAGRGSDPGSVVIQTYDPDHYCMQFASNQDYKGFYSAEIEFRKYMGYPPYSDLFQIIFTSKNGEAARTGADSWYKRITSSMDEADKNNVFRPQEAYMSKVKETYRYSMLIKCPRGRRRQYSQIIAAIKDEDRKIKKKEYTAVVDINPYSFV